MEVSCFLKKSRRAIKNNLFFLPDLESGLTEKELVSEAFVIYLAGFETSASSMTFALFELAQHQEIQNKLRKEIQDVLKKYNGQIDYESVSEMVYLDKVLKGNFTQQYI